MGGVRDFMTSRLRYTNINNYHYFLLTKTMILSQSEQVSTCDIQYYVSHPINIMHLIQIDCQSIPGTMNRSIKSIIGRGVLDAYLTDTDNDRGVYPPEYGSPAPETPVYHPHTLHSSIHPSFTYGHSYIFYV